MKILFFAVCSFWIAISCSKKLDTNDLKSSDVIFIRPNIISKGPLVYPDSLKSSNTIGKVFVECMIDSLGKIDSAKISRTQDKRLNAAALETVHSYKFAPGVQNGRKVASQVLVLIEFK